MFPSSFRITAVFSFLLLMLVGSPAVYAQDYGQATPLRLSHLEGDVSFWRYGAEDWVEARLNTPLAAGDALYVGGEGILELQMDSRAFIRASDETQLSLVNQTADFTQIKVTTGRVSFDLRTLPAGSSVEVDTPIAVFTIERAGYYRVDVDDDVHFITRRGGQATVVPAGGPAMSIYPSEEIVVRGDSSSARAATYAAPELDGWDRWNYARTDDLIDAVSERYLSPGVAGAYDLDYYGRWRVVPQYGSVWIPGGVAPGWAPYSTGRWVWDPYYQWTWIDDAPWGWAPYHYGRWVYVSGYWAWAPGPVVRRVVYCPALVAFYGVSANVSIGFSIGSSGVGWVALSWGEPLVPWWGSPGFVGRPWWGGWGGPRVVNNVVVSNTTIVNVTNITYVNSRVSNAVIATPSERFGKGHVGEAQVRVTQPQKLTPVRGALAVKPEPASLVAGVPKAKQRPPEKVLSQPVMATRPPREAKLPWRVETPRGEAKDRYVVVPKRPSDKLSRPEFGVQAGEERARPQQQPRFEEKRRAVGIAPPERTMPDSTVRERVERDRMERAAPVEKERREMQPPARMAVPQPAPRSTREDVPDRGVPGAQRMPPEPRKSETVREPERVGGGGMERERIERTEPRAPRVAVPESAPPTARPVPEPQRERIAPEPRRSDAAPGARAVPETARQPEQAERESLPGQPANRMYRMPEKTKDKDKGQDERRGQQPFAAPQ